MATPQTLKDALRNKLRAKELLQIPSGYDRLGNLIIIEIPDALRKRTILIGKTLLALHPGVTTVCAKAGVHTGRFRTQKLKVIAGAKTTEACYTENRIKLLLDAAKVYFSPRLATERLRIAQDVQDNEKVLVMFSGCGPYQLVIAKMHPSADVVGIELNPVAHAYAQKNTVLNKLSNVENYC